MEKDNNFMHAEIWSTEFPKWLREAFKIENPSEGFKLNLHEKNGGKEVKISGSVF